MKKTGFTLAEVLITLTIIGVVATITLPSLMTNTAEQQAKTALKKGINTLTEAAQMSQAIDGIDYASLTSTDTTGADVVSAPSLYNLLYARTQVDSANSGTGKLNLNGAADANNHVIFFRDGSALIFNKTNATSTGTSGTQAASNIQSDGLPYGIAAVLDINGRKGPNLVSNCEGRLTGNGSDGVTTTKRESASNTLDMVCSKQSRVIKDQFAVRLRAGYAVPNSPAARWAFEN